MGRLHNFDGLYPRRPEACRHVSLELQMLASGGMVLLPGVTGRELHSATQTDFNQIRSPDTDVATAPLQLLDGQHAPTGPTSDLTLWPDLWRGKGYAWE
jgi:hypothetical protein